MSSYDVERQRQTETEIRKAFHILFPLVNENDLPWAISHIEGFLRDRIKEEVSRGTAHFVNRIAMILCEVSPPKTHMEDMARIVVEKAKLADGLTKEKERRVYYQDIVYTICNKIDRLRGVGKIVCGTLENPTSEVPHAIDEIVTEIQTLRSAIGDRQREI